MLIRHRLTLRFTLLVLAIQLGFSAFIYYFHATSRAQRFAHRLANSATVAGRLLVRTHPSATSVLGSLRRGDLLTLPREEISIYGPDNLLCYSSTASLDQAANRARLQRWGNESLVIFPALGQREAVGVVVADASGPGPYRVLVSAEDWAGWAQLRRLGLLLGLANVGALALAIGAGWVFAGAALRPVARIGRRAARISATNLGQRLPTGNGRDELAQLALVFNTMLAGLEQAFEGQRSFLSHASHELRTPLTGLVGTLETALAYDQTLPAARESLTQSLAAARRLSTLTTGLLQLAKADGALPTFVPIRLDDCLHQALATVRAQYPGREWRLAMGLLPTSADEAPAIDWFTLAGNAELLTAALLNLLDNAGKYSSGPVRTELAYTAAHTLRITVADAGPGLLPEELRRIYEPLYRSAGALSAPGFGLGLPLSQRIIQRHGGRLELASLPGQGTTATVWLPAAP